jgi:hypothetical protein
MYSLSITTRPVASDFLSQQGPIIPDWYEPLLFCARAQVNTGSEPALQLAPKFDDESGELKATRQRLELLQARQYDLLALQE